jgi:hypothetical protein
VHVTHLAVEPLPTTIVLDTDVQSQANLAGFHCRFEDTQEQLVVFALALVKAEALAHLKHVIVLPLTIRAEDKPQSQ